MPTALTQSFVCHPSPLLLPIPTCAIHCKNSLLFFPATLPIPVPGKEKEKPLLDRETVQGLNSVEKCKEATERLSPFILMATLTGFTYCAKPQHGLFSLAGHVA